MKKEVLKVLAISAIGVGLVASLVPASLAWIEKRTELSGPAFVGETEGAYFAGGDGSEENPYLLTHPIHVYNMAWLQYYGEFNKEDEDHNLTKQYFFQLNNDIDMADQILPPTGTSLYPFVGSFNGQGHTISNFTIANQFLEFDKKPFALTEITDVEIVGFFGVIGNLSGGTLVYNSQKNKVYNLGLEDFTIQTGTSQTLAGLAAGYVNGTLSGVAVNDGEINYETSCSPITTYTSKLSNYGTVGYTTNPYKTTVTIRDTDVRDPDVQYNQSTDGGDQWGASIAMSNMYNNINSSEALGSRLQYVSSETRTYDVNGQQVGEPTNVQYTNAPGPSNSTYPKAYEKKEDGKVIASYSTTYRTDTQAYKYIAGEKDVTIANGKTVTKHYYEHVQNTVLISDGNGNYMGRNGTNITNVTSSGSAISFAYADNLLFTAIDYTTYYLTTDDGESFYLTTNEEDAIPFRRDGNYLLVDAEGGLLFFLTCDNGTWKLSQLSTTDYFYIMVQRNSNTYYMTYSGSAFGANSTKANGAKFYLNNSHIYTKSGNTNIYIGGSYSTSGNIWNRKYSYSVVANNNPSYYFTKNGSNLTTTMPNSILGGTTVYMNLNDGATGYAAATSNNSTSYSFIYDYVTNPTTVSMPSGENLTFSATSVTQEDATYHRPATYIPLAWDTTDPNKVSNINTGYLVGGCQAGDVGDIRVSGYPMKDIAYSMGVSRPSNDNQNISYQDAKVQIITKNQYTNGKYVRIKDTHNSAIFNNGGDTASGYNSIVNKTDGSMDVEDLKFEKYADSRNALESTLKNQSTIYGLHFMDASISTSSLITAEKATVNSINNITSEDKSYLNYELPQSCIDFNLKRKGVCNFIGGSYFPGNTTFFSLHEITRNPSDLTKITGIKEIEAIYLRSDAATNPSNPYCYKYVGEAKPSLATGNAIFETTWIKNIDLADYALYYFEIPLNPGEFALGSVSGKDGAYLIYLDIGAATRTVESIVVKEKLEIEYVTYEFPIGVDFVAVMPTSADDFNDIQGGDIATIVIPSGTQGTVTFSLADSILTCGPPSGTTLSSTFAGLDITIKTTGNVTITPDATAEGSEVITTITTYDYEGDSAVLTTTIVRDIVVKDKNGTVISSSHETPEPDVEYNVINNPYASVVTYTGWTKFISGIKYSTKGNEAVTVSYVFDPITDTYTITFLSDVDITGFKVYFDSDVAVPSKYHIKIGNVTNCPDIAAGDSYTFDITASA